MKSFLVILFLVFGSQAYGADFCGIPVKFSFGTGQHGYDEVIFEDGSKFPTNKSAILFVDAISGKLEMCFTTNRGAIVDFKSIGR
jgi:hypothetical protein